MNKIVVLLSLLLIFGSCQKDTGNYVLISSMQKSETTKEFQKHRGQELMETHCYVCHSPVADFDELIAPPMAAIKAHYLLNGPSKGEFIQQVTTFVENPTKEKSFMPGAINRFGLMPVQKFPENSVEQIAEYMYDYQIAEPDWFAAHWKAGPGSGKYQQPGKRKGAVRDSQLGGDQREHYQKKGIQIAMEAQKLLGQNLMREIKNNGVLYALEFCKIQAIPLTDSAAVRFEATVQRVSNRNRNPTNAANSQDKALIKVFEREMATGGEPQPILKIQKDSVKFYYPLITNSLCLQCHGKQEDMDYAVKEKILKLYPQDRATGYSENEIRGIWKIGFKR